MSKYHGVIAVFFAAVLALSGCNSETVTSGASQTELASSTTSTASIASTTSTSEPGLAETDKDTSVSPTEPEQSYIDQVVRDTIAKFAEPDMGEYDKAKAAFDYLIESTSLTEPVGLDLWRIRGENDELPSFVENRSLSVLLYGIGMCEDYAAAFTMLLRGMGLEAEYVPGLTYAANGSGLVDHAWTVAKIDGVWYHLDCQLEDNISRHDTIRYKYFMRNDATMAGSHRWGQNLIDSRLLTAAQNEEIARNFLFEPCLQDYPTPSRRTFTSAPMPDVGVIKTEIEAEFREYESVHSALEPLELNIIPPVFGLEGFGPPD